MTGPWSPGLRGVTVGASVLMASFALEYVAVGAAMPTIAAALDGYAHYSMAFGSTVAASVVGMVLGGWGCDRRGPSPVLVLGAVIFALGLVLAGVADSFVVLCLGRALQGVGTGAANVGTYVLIARTIPDEVRPRVFSVLAAAWVVPGLVGPLLTGWVVEHLTWHWVFLGVVPFVVAGLAVLSPALRRVPGTGVEEAPSMTRAMIGWTVVAAAAVGVLNLAGETVDPGEWAVGGVALALLVVAARGLLPDGSLRLRRGIPALMGVRGALGASFVSAEAFLPLMLRDEHGYSPAASGAVLAVGAVTWTLGSALQGRAGAAVDRHRLMLWGTTLYSLLLAVLVLGVWLGWPGWVVVALYGGAILGVGLAYPTATVVMMRLSSEAEIGRNSSSLQLSEALAGALVLAVAGLVFGLSYADDPRRAFTTALSVSVVAGATSMAAAGRSRPRRAL